MFLCAVRFIALDLNTFSAGRQNLLNSKADLIYFSGDPLVNEHLAILSNFLCEQILIIGISAKHLLKLLVGTIRA